MILSLERWFFYIERANSATIVSKGSTEIKNQMPNVRIEVNSKRSAGDLFKILTNGPNWPKWSKVGKFELLKDGDSGGETINSIRRFSTGVLKITEQITAMEPNKSFSYRAIAGIPVKSYDALVCFNENGDITTITWTAEFTASKWLEPVMKVVIHQILKTMATDLAKTTIVV